MATTRVAIAPMKVAQIPKAGADFQIVDREIPKPGAGHRLIGIAKIGWRTGHSGDCAKLESDVRADQRSGAERQAHGGGPDI